tara:strand:- start:3379 stop:3738 length:360 start_codon:yes stop_codon:yes gene_type:complete
MQIQELEQVLESAAEAYANFSKESNISEETYIQLKHILAGVVLSVNSMKQSLNIAENKLEKAKPKPEPKAVSKPEPKAVPIPKAVPKAVPKAMPQPEPKAMPQPEPKAVPQPEPKAVPK